MLTAGTAQAGEEGRGLARGQPSPVSLLASSPRQDLGSHLEIFRDPSGVMSFDDVQRGGPQAFEPAQGQMSLGFISDAVWLRFVVDRQDMSQPAIWWLVLSQTLVDRAQLYVLAGDARQPAGTPNATVTPQAQERLADRRVVFELDLPELGPHTVYLRLQSRASMSMTATLWQPTALAAATTNESFAWGAMFGAYVLIIVFYLAFWAWTRELLHGSYVVYVLCNFLAALFTGGWPRQIWPSLEAETTLTLLGIWVTLPLLLGSWFTVLLLGLHRQWPRLSRVFLSVCVLVVAVAMPLILLGYYQPVVPVIQSVSIVVIGFIYLISLYLALRGDRTAWLYLGAFGFFYVGVVWRYLRNIGLLEPSFWNDNSYQFGAFVHMLVMSVGIFSLYGRLRRQSKDAQVRVAAATALREEQRDFMAMVSHEFRAPLSIISAATNNLLHGSQLPAAARERVQKVVRANDRMSSLMEQYLANERLLLDGAEPTLESCDLLDVCRRACEEFEPLGSPQPVLRGARGVMLRCDENLLQIALANLLANARRHSPAEAPVEIEVSADGNTASVCVRDQGSGMPQEEMSDVFKRFYRGRNALDSPGAGLGLYLVQTIASRHGGSVTVRNLEPAGCEFMLSLPLGEPAVAKQMDRSNATVFARRSIFGRVS